MKDPNILRTQILTSYAHYHVFVVVMTAHRHGKPQRQQQQHHGCVVIVVVLFRGLACTHSALAMRRQF